MDPENEKLLGSGTLQQQQLESKQITLPSEPLLQSTSKTCFRKLEGSNFATALRHDPGPMAAVFVTCVSEFAMPGIIPYLVPCGEDHASQSFWVTLCYLTGSLLGRMMTALRHYRGLTLLNMLQFAGLVYGIVISRLEDPFPVWISTIIITVFSMLHGYIVTEVFLVLGHSARQAAVGGLMNQAGALTGSLVTFAMVKSHIIVARQCCH